MLQLGLFPEAAASGTRALVINFGGKELSELVQITRSLRDAGISSELYPDVARLKKQFAYADARRIPWVIIAGSEELAAGQVTVKEMKTGGQQKIDIPSLPAFINTEKAVN